MCINKAEEVQVVVVHCLITWQQLSLLRLKLALKVRQGKDHQHLRGIELDQQRNDFHFRCQNHMVLQWDMETMDKT